VLVAQHHGGYGPITVSEPSVNEALFVNTTRAGGLSSQVLQQIIVGEAAPEVSAQSKRSRGQMPPFAAYSPWPIQRHGPKQKMNRKKMG
jgi:hypothetical protein